MIYDYLLLFYLMFYLILIGIFSLFISIVGSARFGTILVVRVFCSIKFEVFLAEITVFYLDHTISLFLTCVLLISV